MAKGGSKVATGIIAFLLGFLFAIIVEVGVILGASYFVLYSDLETLFSLVGFTNKDSDGNQYINTDEASGGVSNIIKLYESLMDMYGRIGSVTLTEVEVLFPALDGLTAKLYDAVNDYVMIDWDEFESTAFMDLPMLIEDAVMEIRPAGILRDMGMDSALDNLFVGALLEGVEASYVYVNPSDKDSSLKYPVYYDEYVRTELEGGVTYNRTQPVDDIDVYPSNLSAEQWLTETSRKNADGKTVYRQYFYSVATEEGVVYVATKADESGDYLYSSIIDSSNTYYDGYGEDSQYLTGNYYLDNDGTRVFRDPITIRSLTEDTFAPLYSLTLSEVLGDEEILQELFGETSVGELLNQEVSFEELIDDFTLATLLDVKADNVLMLYIGYNVTQVIANIDGTYSGVYAAGSEDEKEVTVYVDADGIVSQVLDGDGNKINGVTVSEVSDIVGDVTTVLTISDMMDVKPTLYNADGTIIENNNIMAFVAFSISNFSYSGGTYTCTYNVYDEENNVTEYPGIPVIGDDGYIKHVMYDADGDGIYESVGEKTVIDDIPTQISRLTSTLRIKDVVEIDPDNKLMVKLGDYRIDEVGKAVDEFELSDAIDVDATDPIMLYIGYGITDLSQADGAGYTHIGKYAYTGEAGTEIIADCFITIDGTELKEAFYFDEGGNRVGIAGTTLKGVGDRVSSLTDNIAIGDVIDVEADNKIMMYISYGLTNVELVSENETCAVFSAKHGEDTVYITASVPDYLITGFYSDAACTISADVTGTKISAVGEKVGALTSELTIGELIDIEKDDKVLWLVKDSTIDNLAETVNNITLQNLYPDDIYEKDTNGDPVVYQHGSADFNGNYVYYIDEDCRYLAGENGKLGSIGEGEFYYTHGETTGIWKLILCDYDSVEEVYDEKVYKLNDMGSLMVNATENIKHATLGDLQEAGIIASDANLEKTLTWGLGEDQNAVLKDIQLSKLIDIVIGMAV